MLKSLSARRAWIEIFLAGEIETLSWSLSARRAWIEIGVDFAEDWLNASLSARRAWIEMPKIGLMLALSPGRSPQGERG